MKVRVLDRRWKVLRRSRVCDLFFRIVSQLSGLLDESLHDEIIRLVLAHD
jgi:hypothetical protein